MKLIAAHGGQISEDSAQGLFISKYGEAHRNAVDPKFITDSVAKQQLQDVNDYKISPFEDTTEGDSNVDQLVTAYLGNDNHTQPEASDEIGPHNRQARLDAASSVPEGIFVSKQDRISLHNKNGFTDQEDELILEEVRKNPQRRSTHKLFHEIAETIGRHTGNSIRYRYRTHLVNRLKYVYKTNDQGQLLTDDNGKYIPSETMPLTMKNKFTAKDDYILAKAVLQNVGEKVETEEGPVHKDIILPGKFFEKMGQEFPNHTRAAWRDRYRKFLIPYGIDKYVQYYEAEVANDREPEEIKNFTGRHMYKSSKKSKPNEDSDIDIVVRQSLLEHNNEVAGQSQNKRRKPNEVQQTGQDSSNLFLHGDQAEISGIFDSQDAVAVAAAASAQVDGVHPDIEDKLTDDLVTEKFFQFHPLIAVVEKVKEIVERSYSTGEAEELVQALEDEVGVHHKFGMYIIACVCGDMLLIPTFIEMFLKTGENPPFDVVGVWTPRDDQWLKNADLNGDKQALDRVLKLHGEERVELRRGFIEQEYV